MNHNIDLRSIARMKVTILTFLYCINEYIIYSMYTLAANILVKQNNVTCGDGNRF